MDRVTFRGRRSGSTLDEEAGLEADVLPPGRRTLTSGLSRAGAHAPFLHRDGDGRVGAGAADSVARAEGSGGFALPAHLRTRFERSLDADLCGVRIHTGDASAQAAKAVGARAYATGQDIHFGAGHYDPTSTAGVHLLAHEVAHTVQQAGGVARRQHRLEVSMPGDTLEVDADRAADAMVAGARVSVSRGGLGIARDPDPLDGGVPLPAGVPEEAPPDATAPADPAVAGTPNPAPADPADAGAAPAPAPAPARPPGGTPAPTGPVGPAGPTGPTGPTAAPDAPPPSAVPAPTAGPIANAPGGPASGIDWREMFMGPGLNVARTALEVSRLVPGWGIVGGLAADIMEGAQNLDGIRNVSGPAADGMRQALVGRQVVVILVNGLNHIRYVCELGNDVALASIVGAELAPILMSAQEIMAGISVGAQLGLTAFDIMIAVRANQLASQAGEGTDAYKAYHELKRNFIVNVGGDGVGVLLDLLDLASGGLANAAGIKQAKSVITATTRMVRGAKVSLLPLINAWVGVWGDAVWNWIDPIAGAPTPAVSRDPDPSAAGGGEAAGPGGGRVQVGPNGVLRSVAAQIMMAEIDQIEAGYRFGATAVEYAAGMPQRTADEVSRVITEITGEQQPFVWLRDRIAAGLEEGTAQISRLLEMKNTATQAQVGATAASGLIDTAIAGIDGLVMPQMPEPTPTDLGDNAVADAAEFLVDGARGLTADAINAVRDQLQTAIDQVKGACRQKAVDAKAELAGVVDFLTQFAAMANEQTAQIAALGAQAAERLSGCNNVEDIFNMIFAMGTEVMGADEFTVDDLRAIWVEVRGLIDQGFVAARRVAADVGGGGGEAAPVSRDADGNEVTEGAGAAVSRAQESDGTALPGTLREGFETSLGADLSGVRVHTGSASAQAARAVGARAYATGQDIHFADGKYDPSSAAGQRLLAHEVAHTVQHASGQAPVAMSQPGDAHELDAERAADAMMGDVSRE